MYKFWLFLVEFKFSYLCLFFVFILHAFHLLVYVVANVSWNSQMDLRTSYDQYSGNRTLSQQSLCFIKLA
jgi:hypothetical protein